MFRPRNFLPSTYLHICRFQRINFRFVQRWISNPVKRLRASLFWLRTVTLDPLFLFGSLKSHWSSILCDIFQKYSASSQKDQLIKLFQCHFIIITIIMIIINIIIIIKRSRGRVDDLSFFEYLSPFYFLWIEFQCTFSISYKILPYFVFYYSILVRM